MKQPSDKKVLIRLAIEKVLAAATEPMISHEVAEHHECTSLGFSPNDVAMELSNLWRMQSPPFPIARIGVAEGKSMYAYFNPKVVQIGYTPAPPRHKAAPPTAAPVNGVNSADFQFNPVEFADTQVQVAPPVQKTNPPEAAVALPAGVKSITLTVSGVTVRIELA